ncbi:MAG: GspE/PulE family protein [Pseudomonadota bacterium]
MPDIEVAHVLEEAGLIGRDQADLLRREGGCSVTGQLNQVERLGFAEGAEVRRVAGRALGCPAVELDEHLPASATLALVPRELARRYQAVPIALQDGQLSIAMADPCDLLARDALEKFCLGNGVDAIEYCLASGAALERAWQRFYPDMGPRDLPGLLAEDEGLRERWTSEAVDAMLLESCRRGASDIHLEPDREYARLRLRVDGVMESLSVLSKRQYARLLGRLKVLCDLDMGENRLAQDGKMHRRVEGRPTDFRAALMPTLHGEVLVLRVLDRSARDWCLSDLDLGDGVRKALEALVQIPQGMVVVCGPTGSGKTTTLYALLSALDKHRQTIATLEDPVEYPTDGIRQTDLSRGAKLGFAEGVRALMRQDPDVLLIGEIRDSETAAMALRAAMTGHRVLTSVHAATPVGALRRLAELGVDRANQATYINGVIAQRLIRRLCGRCRRPSGLVRKDCKACAGRGYRGRRALLDILRLDAERKASLERGEWSRLGDPASLERAALAAVTAGDTDWDEYCRVFGQGPALGDGQEETA